MHIATIKSPGWDTRHKRTFAGGYTFSDINKAGPLTKDFMKFIRSCDKYKRKATKRGFYKIIKREWIKYNLRLNASVIWTGMNYILFIIV